MNGFGNLSLRSILSFQIGLILGLAPSSLSQAIMFPVQNPNIIKTFGQLRSHDLNMLASIYPSELAGPRGRVLGRVRDGNTGGGLAGALLYLLPEDKVDQFASSSSMDLLVQSSSSREGGQFIFEGVPVGKYVVLMESLPARGFVKRLFDDWMKVFANEDYFSSEFYDGKGRESNSEPSVYSPQLVRIAAKVEVLADSATEPVVLFTQKSDEDAELRKAPGSNHEELSEYTFEDIQDLVQEEITKSLKNQKSESSGGCGVAKGPSPASTSLVSLAWMFLMLICLRFRFRLGLKARSRPAEFQ